MLGILNKDKSNLNTRKQQNEAPFVPNAVCLCLGPFVPGPVPALHAPCTVKVLYLNPRPSVIFGSSPGVDQALPVEACKVRVPLLQAKERAVGR